MSLSNKNVLFCYINPASGHQKAAEAVMAALRQMNPRVHAEGVNSISYANPVLGRMISRLYLNILKHAPQLWEVIYDNPVVEEATRDVREMFSLFNARKTARIVKEHRPRVIVCTQAVPLNLLAALKARGKMKIPLVGVITDYGVHTYWMSKAVDLYLVPTEEVRRKMIRAGIRETHVKVTGIPVDPIFLTRGDGRVERARLGLDPRRPTALVMGGSHGLGPLDEAVAALRRLPGGLQVIVACGNNRSLLKDLNKRFKDDRSVLLLGHTRQVPRLMDASDFLVSKPGGMTTSEALTKGLPMIIVNPIPGQEEWNAAYLLKNGAAERADDLPSLMERVRDLLLHRDRLEKMKERCLKLARPWAAYDAAEEILNLVEEPVLARPAGAA